MRSHHNTAYTEIQNRVIYALISPIDKKVFIGQSLENLARDTYRKHYTLTNYKTEEMIKELKESDIRPCFFILEKVRDTKVKTYYLQIVWTRIFMDLGYEILDNGIIDYANDLNNENQEKYEIRKTKFNIDKVCTCEKCEVQKYGRVECSLKEVKDDGIQNN